MAYNNENMRLKDYKTVGKDTEDFRRKMIESNVELRKCNKQEKLDKRRFINFENITPAFDNKDDNFNQVLSTLLNSRNDAEVSAACSSLRRIVSGESFNVKNVVLVSAIPAIFSILNRSTDAIMVLDCLWILTNLCYHPCGASYVMAIPNSLELMHKFLTVEDVKIQTQTIWLLGNMAGETRDYAAKIIHVGYIELSIQCSGKNFDVEQLETTLWFLSNLFRYRPHLPSASAIKMILDFALLVLNTKVSRVYNSLIHVLNTICQYYEDYHTYILENAPLDEVIKIVSDTRNDYEPQRFFLLMIGHMISGKEGPTQTWLDLGIVPVLKELYCRLHTETNRKEILWIVSNICAGTERQKKFVMQFDLFSMIMDGLANQKVSILKESMWCIYNFLTGCTLVEFESIMSYDWIKIFCNICRTKRTSVGLLQQALNTFEVCFEKATEFLQLYDVLNIFSGHDGCELLEQMQCHENEEIYKLGKQITERFFGSMDDEYEEYSLDAQDHSVISQNGASRGFNF